MTTIAHPVATAQGSLVGQYVILILGGAKVLASRLGLATLLIVAGPGHGVSVPAGLGDVSRALTLVGFALGESATCA